MRSHIDKFSTPDLLTIIATKAAIDTDTVFVEANKVKNEIMASVYDVSNLTGVAILGSSSQSTKTPASISNKYHTNELEFLRLSCTIDSNEVDCRINQEPLCLGFRLKLHQFSYDQ